MFDGSGFNVETVEYKNVSFTVWDVGGQDKVFVFFWTHLNLLRNESCAYRVVYQNIIFMG